jgi:hypothetical protein
MPLVSLKRLEELLMSCESYLEYGCGGSTTLAAKLGVKNIIYCDTSKVWIDSVEKIIRTHSNINSYPTFINLGEVAEWGRPKDQSKAILWKNYCYRPWAIAKSNNLHPNLILIDGRFRVASFLASLLLGNSETIILFDDYSIRSHYHIIENIIKPIKAYDRMAEFVIPKEFDRSECLFMLLENINNVN